MDSGCALYEFPLLRRITGDTLRPGGLDITGRALDLCGIRPPGRVLDIGCGGGASLDFFRKQGLDCVGMDISLSLLREAAAMAPVVMADAHCLPFRADSFQAVFCECVVSLLSAPGQAFEGVNRVLSPGGWFIVSDIVLLAGNSGGPVRSCVQGARTRQEMRELFDGAGFALRHSFDCRKALRELAAKMVWEFGSMDAFWALWQKSCHGSSPVFPCGTALGYDLFIAQKVAVGGEHLSNEPERAVMAETGRGGQI